MRHVPRRRNNRDGSLDNELIKSVNYIEVVQGRVH